MSRLWLQTADGALRADQIAELRTENQTLDPPRPGRHTADERYCWALDARHVSTAPGLAPEVVVAAGGGYLGGAAAAELARVLARHAHGVGLVWVRTGEHRPGVESFLAAGFETLARPTRRTRSASPRSRPMRRGQDQRARLVSWSRVSSRYGQ